MEDFISDYIDRGFGSMTKNDFEVFIFNQILLMPKYKGKGNYDLSVLLKIPESKVKRLRYEAALKYSPQDRNFKDEVLALLENVELRGSNKRIVFQVEDVILKSYISSILKKYGRSLDSSFNPELIVIHFEDFEVLAKEIYSGQEYENILKEAKKASSDFSWTKFLEELACNAVQGVTSGLIVKLTPVSILQNIKKKLLNNGTI